MANGDEFDGYLSAGTYQLLVTVDGYEPHEQSVRLEEGTCHAVPRTLTILLTPT